MLHANTMAKTVSRTGLMLLVAASVAVLLLAASAGSAQAGGHHIRDLQGSVNLSIMKSGETIYYESPDKKKISSVKSSNKKVLTVKLQKNGMLKLTKKKPGKAKVTYKLAGKKKTANVVLHKYQNPLKTFKIGSKDYAAKFNKRCEYYPSQITPGKLVVKPARNWVVKQIYIAGDNHERRVKGEYMLNSEQNYISVYLVNKKTKVEASVLLTSEHYD